MYPEIISFYLSRLVLFQNPYIYILFVACTPVLRLWSFGGSHIPRKQAGFKVSFQQVLCLWDLFGLLIKISLVLVYSADFAEVNSQIVENFCAVEILTVITVVTIYMYSVYESYSLNNSEC